jgi:hypothetical protein
MQSQCQARTGKPCHSVSNYVFKTYCNELEHDAIPNVANWPHLPRRQRIVWPFEIRASASDYRPPAIRVIHPGRTAI